MAVLPSFSLHSAKSPQIPNSNSSSQHSSCSCSPRRNLSLISKREIIFETLTVCVASLTLQTPLALAAANSSLPSKATLPGIANTKSWLQFFGDGFSIRVPPQFRDIMEPEDYNAGLSFYGDKAKPKTFAARFSSDDGSEMLTVIIKPSNQLKINFLEAKDVTDLGSLKEASKIFVPVGATIYTARTIKIKEDEGYRTYYFYEFGRDEQHVALVAAVSSGKAFVAGATAPESMWDNDGVKLRSAAISLTLL
ncbi:hypothetical protein Nepgr_001532 [Nepenthes gracilis]|uniref:PsbP C-terminal domain-containing protein n=1 Tax=Nepenthes gracilis TaxID=150966 RepID=A0AAD3P7B0_NEPGR|nr:hypothetical protein Nepgr_001532 [Nepenthes gracilis]